MRSALRSLARTPGFAAVAIATLALGIGANTAIFSIVNAVLLRPYPHIDTDRWAFVYERASNSEALDLLGASIPNFRDWREQSTSFSAMALWMTWSYNLSGAGQPERVAAAVVTPGVFTALEVAPAAGRWLNATDEPQSAERPIVIGYELWQRRFGGDSAIVGRTIDLNLVPHTVVGVAPPRFSFPPDVRTEIWAPYSETMLAGDTARDARGYSIAACLAPGADFRSAQAELDLICERLAAAHPEDRGYGARIVPMREAVSGSLRTPLLALSGAVVLVLLLACVNLANLQLVRLEARQKEFAVRAALGAGRGHLVRQLLAESAVLVGCAGLIGVLAAPALTHVLLTFIPAEQISWLNVTTDATVLLVAAAAVLFVGLVCGLLPAWRAGRVDLSAVLSSSGSGGGTNRISRRMRHAFLVAQVALACVPVIGAGLFIRSFLRLQSVDPGFSPERRLTLSFSAPRARYAEGEKIAALANALRDEIAAIPSVSAAGVAQALPFAAGLEWWQALTREDPSGITDLAAVPHVAYNVVSAGFSEALGVNLKAGRTIQSSDAADREPVVVINESLARLYFPGENPVGMELWIGHAQALPELPARTVIGVVGDAMLRQLDEPAPPAAWVPLAQQIGGVDTWRSLFLVVHAAQDPRVLTPQLREAFARVDPELALTNIATLEQRLGDALWRQRLAANLLGTLAAAALVIAVLGVFAIVSYLVGRRTHEIGVRMAIGATPGNILQLILRESGLAVAVGLLIGGLVAAAGARLIGSFLYGGASLDVSLLAITVGALTGAALLACLGPARRAARRNPLEALRNE